VSTRIGLRERKKRQTRQALHRTAMELFVERGFENVTIAEIAEAAEVSKMTITNYFPAKDDIVFDGYGDAAGEPSAVVLGRAPGESAVAALRRAFLSGLARRDPLTGLNDGVTTFFRLVLDSPTLLRRQIEIFARSEDALARTLAQETGADPDDIAPRAAAAQLVGVQRALVSDNCRRLVAGGRADELYPGARESAVRAFDLLESGLAGYCVRPVEHPPAPAPAA
jgi:AcrR family transcriptional regulator